MDDIQKRADDKAWDKKQDGRISDQNRKIESGLIGEALAALHGLRVPSNDEPPCDVDDTSEADDQTTLREKIIMRLIQIGKTVSRNRDLPDDVKVKLQSYITGCYGSLTSFNVLFADDGDQFRGSSESAGGGDE